VVLAQFLTALALKVQPNDASLKSFDRFRRSEPFPIFPGQETLHGWPLGAYSANVGPDRADGDRRLVVQRHETPSARRREIIQMQYGSIGWSVGATLGLALRECRVIAAIGDGSFQLSAQVSTMIRYELRPIIFL